MTPREPDRLDKQAQEIVDSFIDNDDARIIDDIQPPIVAALRAAESSALERAQKKMEGVARVWRPESGVSLLEIVQDVFCALIPPAAARAAPGGGEEGKR